MRLSMPQKKTNNQILDEVFKDTDHKLEMFTSDNTEKLKLPEEKGKYLIYCAKRQKNVPAKPEEMVRQLYIQKLKYQ